MSNDNKDATLNMNIVARIIILVITAVVGVGFIYSMLYKGTTYEALFGDGGYFSEIEKISSDSKDEEKVKNTPTIKPDSTPSPSPSPTVTSTEPKETPTPTIEPSPTFEVLKRGSENSKVRELQTLLIKKGYYNGPITGYFGSMTEDAVIYFQGKNRLPQTGIVDYETMQKLLAAEDKIK